MIRTFKKPAIPTQKLPVDGIEVRESGLLTPGKKPIGSVKSTVDRPVSDIFLFRRDLHSVNGLPLTLSGTATYSINAGGNQVITLGSPNYLVAPIRPASTKQTWVFRLNPVAASDQIIVMNRAVFNGTDGIEIYHTATAISVRGSGTSRVDGSYGTADWMTIHVVYDNTTATIYKNGVYVTSGTVGAIQTPTYDLYIGKYVTAGYYLGSPLEYLQVIDGAAMTENQVAAHAADLYQFLEPA